MDALVAVASILGGLGGFLAVLVTLHHFNKKWCQESVAERAAANREVYQRLELASIDLFRFAADHEDLVALLWEEGTVLPKRGTARYWVFFDYVCQHLNLFEMAVRLYHERVMPQSVLGSWVTWFYDVCSAPHFAHVWEEVRPNYVCELVRIIDGGVEIVRNHRTDKEAGRRAFFDFAAGEKQLKYPGLRTWLTADATPCTEKQASSGQRAFPDIEVRWCDDPQQVDALARFFVDNASGSTDYISHGEIQDGRAEAPNQWSPDLLSVITGAFGSAVSPQNPGRDSARLAVALSQNEVVGIALVDFRLSAKQPFAVLQDLVVSGQRRSSGVGSVMLRWVEARVLEQGCRLLFLESGITNERAHSFFERHGFSVCSKVMIKQLPGQRPTGLVAS